MCRRFIVGMLILVGCGRDGGVSLNPDPDLEPKTDHTTGDLVIDLPNGTKMAFMWIEPGTFMMGTPQSESEVLEEGLQGDDTDIRKILLTREIPQHQVRLSEGFYLGKYEVTVGQWMSVMGEDEVYTDQEDYPIYKILFTSMQTFIDSLNQMNGDTVYRLPTEAEWEYASRAGASTTWWFGSWAEMKSGQISDYDLRLYTGSNFTHPELSSLQDVGLTIPNPWGLYDMHGNVAEWVLEGGLRKYSEDSQVDPVGPAQGFIELPSGFTETGAIRYLRYDRIHLLRGAPSADQRLWMRPAYRGVYLELDVYVPPPVGFRLVIERR